MKLILFSLIFTLCSFFVVSADKKKTENEYKQILISEHRAVLKDFSELPDIKQAIIDENNKFDGLVKVIQLDSTWQINRALQKTLIHNSIAQVLMKLVQDPNYNFTEIMLLNNLGSIVAAYPRTSDYWQGDEDKFQQPIILNGDYSGTTKWDQSTKTYSFFYCILIKDKKNNIIGVLVAGLDVSKEYLKNSQ
ncbi:PDC sensor domain-containing protein [Pseudoalteromonas denitrificans]|uniref:Cache domain-containing protein n=1 Tax=Pseudoalteromonas denitrificans DSM 6059 TaxID=1123010 RepID=A0A1I1EM48_9GAMM|nr:PDC sensor domain-containing protein [Pseudoalteromonas denitrificans]SFB88171.1 hypothetical protein SAMN02745724_00346 [Pseudoalteromonas denitrificans DSM 6059]